MKRAAVFAHYDKDAIIQDYVIYYLKALRLVCDELVFVSSNRLSSDEIAKIEGVADYIIAEKHNEYDFGSYKRGFLYVMQKGQLEDFDELIFVNDSCYGPFYPLKNIFDEMDSRDCDFWGITKNSFSYRDSFKLFTHKSSHLQSYFLVFQKKVFVSDVFKDFILNIKAQDSKAMVISYYEMGLTKILEQKGFKADVYIKAFSWINNVTILTWRQIIQFYGMPFIKKSLIDLRNTDITTIDGFDKIVFAKSSYPLDLFKLPREINRKAPLYVKRFVFDIVANLPFPLRRLAAIAIGRLFPFFKD